MLKHAPAIALLICLLSASPLLAAVEFIYPAPGSWVASSGHIIFKLNQTDLNSVRITLNGTPSDMIDVGSPEYRKLFRDFFIAQAMWDPGVNNLTVDLFRGGQKIETAAMPVYMLIPGRQPPPEFKPVTMHQPEREKQCEACHTVNPTAAQMNSTSEKANPCYRCHKKMLTVKYVHGPVGTYSCGYCHASKGSPKHAVPKKGAELCYECHSDMAGQMKKKKFVHGPIEAGMCDACHDPHGSQNESQLHKPINELCLSCHGHIATQTHVVRTTTGEGHPLKGKQDPAKKGSGREMTCISCHAPHGGNVRYFFVNNPDDRLQLCQMCHNK